MFVPGLQAQTILQLAKEVQPGIAGRKLTHRLRLRAVERTIGLGSRVAAAFDCVDGRRSMQSVRRRTDKKIDPAVTANLEVGATDAEDVVAVAGSPIATIMIAAVGAARAIAVTATMLAGATPSMRLATTVAAEGER